jgi:hypothetical protein
MSKEPNKTPQYVIGTKTDGFCWLSSRDTEESADDQNIEMARRFVSLGEARNAASEAGLDVFEIIDETVWPAKLELVD